MRELYGKCGCNCGTCPAFIGNIKSDEDKQKCSAGWKKYLNISLKPQMCVCRGCQAEDPWKPGNILPDRACLVRKCAKHNQLRTCADCGSFPCEFLSKRSDKDYSRGWVEKRTGEAITDEIYETFVQSYETFINLKKIRKSMKDDKIAPCPPVAPLTVKAAKFPSDPQLTEHDTKNLRAIYDVLLGIQECRSEIFIEQALNSRNIEPALFILWVFACYGEFDNEECTKLVLTSSACECKREFGALVRSRDNYWRSTAESAVKYLSVFGLHAEFTQLSKKASVITLSCCGENKDIQPLAGLKRFSCMLIEKYGMPEFKGAWKYKGRAFKNFKNLDLNFT